jgi:hypothetical protein
MNFTSFNVYIAGRGQASGTEAAALSIVAFGLTWLMMLLLLAGSRASGFRRRAPTIGGAR